MTIDEIIEQLKLKSGNSQRGESTVYFSAENALEFAKNSINMKPLTGILITPFLVGDNGRGAALELQYYFLNIEVGEGESHLDAWPEPNSLPKEITENIKPKAFVAENDNAFYQSVLLDYLEKLANMNFLDFAKPEFIAQSKLFYEIVY